MQPVRACFSALLVLTSQMATAEVNASLDYVYYTAIADPGSSLAAILQRATPIRSNGSEYLGWTSWHVNWHFHWHFDADGRCRITDVTTELTGTITLPKLENATASQSKDMDTLLAGLRVHELGHYDIGKDAAEKIDSGVLGLPEMQSCPILEAAANGLAQRILDEHRDTELRYDAVTAHGRLQGAWQNP